MIKAKKASNMHASYMIWMRTFGSVNATYRAITFIERKPCNAIRGDRFCRQSHRLQERFTRRLCFRISGFALRREMHSSPFALFHVVVFTVRHGMRMTCASSIGSIIICSMLRRCVLMPCKLLFIIIMHLRHFSSALFFHSCLWATNAWAWVRCAREWNRQYRVSLNFVLVSIEQREIFRKRSPPFENIWSSVES